MSINTALTRLNTIPAVNAKVGRNLSLFLPKGVILSNGEVVPSYRLPLACELADHANMHVEDITTVLGDTDLIASGPEFAALTQGYTAIVQQAILSSVHKEFDAKLKGIWFSRNDLFEAAKNVLGNLGLNNFSVLFYDPLQNNLNCIFGEGRRSEDLPDFLANPKKVRYENKELLFRADACESESFIFSVIGPAIFPGRTRTLLDVCGLLADKLETGFIFRHQINIRQIEIERGQAFDRLAKNLDKGLSDREQGSDELSIVGNVMGMLPEIFPRTRSASIALWNAETESLEVAGSLGVTLGNLAKESDPDKNAKEVFPLAQKVLLERREMYVRGGIIGSSSDLFPVKRSGDFVIAPIYQDKERTLPLGVVSISFEASRYLDQGQIRALEKLVGILRSKLTLSQLIKEIEWASKHDGLTGLLDHRAGEERLNSDFATMVAQQKPISLLMVDLDHFKAVNDTHGHKAGDFVLKQLTKLMQQLLEAAPSYGLEINGAGYAVRYGGEEFHFVLPGVDQKTAIAFAEQFRKLVEAAEFDIGFNRKLKKTASIGVATANQDASFTRVEELIDLADQAMYKAKGEGGRNRVAVARKQNDFYYPF